MILKEAQTRDKEFGYTGIRITIYQTLSSWIVNLLKKTYITANQVTVFGCVCVLIAAFLLGIEWGLLAVLFLYLGELADAVDGTLARVKNQCSRLQSSLLGNIYHSFVYPALFIGIGWSVGEVKYLMLGIIAGLIQLTIAVFRFYNASKGKKENISQAKFNLASLPMKWIRVVILVSVFISFKPMLWFYCIFNIIKLERFIQHLK